MLAEPTLAARSAARILSTTWSMAVVVAANHDLRMPEPERILLELLHNVRVLINPLARYGVREKAPGRAASTLSAPARSSSDNSSQAKTPVGEMYT